MLKEPVSPLQQFGSFTLRPLHRVRMSIRRGWHHLFAGSRRGLNLGTRITLRLGMILGIASLVLFGLLYRLQVRQMHEQVHTQAEALLTNMLTVREWVASYGGVWTTQPGPVYMETRNGFYRKSPAMVTKELSELAAEKGLYRFHITSLRLKNPANAPDAFESEVLHRFDHTPSPVERVEYVNGQRMYRLMVPLRTTAACLQCHADQGYRVGDIRGGLSVMVPMTEADRALAQNRLMLILSAFTIMILVMGGMYVQLRHTVITPIKRLTEIAEAISHGDYQVRCHVNTGDELETLGNTINHMVASIARYQNALHAQVERRTQELATIASIALTASEAKPLNVLLHEALQQVKDVVRAQSGAICLCLKDHIDFVAMLDLPPEIRHCLQDESLQRAVRQFIQTSHRAISIDDLTRVTADPLSRPLLACFLENGRYHSLLAIPLRSRQRTLGFILLFHPRPHAFSEETVQFLTSVGNQLGVAVQNAQYHEQVAQLAVLEERQRIARELHDSIAQTLGWLSLKLEMLREDLDCTSPTAIRQDLDTMQQVVREAIYDVRESILALRQDPSQRLVPAVGAWIADFRRRTGLDVEFQVTDQNPYVSPIIEVEAFRIVQEALTNVRKHARAQHARVELHIRQNGLELIVEDDGQGFAVDHVQTSQHFGIRIMQERAESLGGTFRIQSEPGKGTRVYVRLPLYPTPSSERRPV